MRQRSPFGWDTLHMFIIILEIFSFRYLKLKYKWYFVNTKFATSKTDQFLILGEQAVLMSL